MIISGDSMSVPDGIPSNEAEVPAVPVAPKPPRVEHAPAPVPVSKEPAARRGPESSLPALFERHVEQRQVRFDEKLAGQRDSGRERVRKHEPGLAAALLEGADEQTVVENLEDALRDPTGRELHRLFKKHGLVQAIGMGKDEEVVAYVKAALRHPSRQRELLPIFEREGCRALLERMPDFSKADATRERGQMRALYGIFEALAKTCEPTTAPGVQDQRDCALDRVLEALFETARSGSTDALRLVTVALGGLVDGTPERGRPALDLAIRSQLSSMRSDAPDRLQALLHCFLASDLHDVALDWLAPVWKHCRVDDKAPRPLPFGEDFDGLVKRMLEHEKHEILPRPGEALVALFSTLGRALAAARPARGDPRAKTHGYAARIAGELDRVLGLAAKSEGRALQFAASALEGLVAAAPAGRQAEALHAELILRLQALPAGPQAALGSACSMAQKP